MPKITPSQVVITLDGDEYADFVIGVAGLEIEVAEWLGNVGNAVSEVCRLYLEGTRSLRWTWSSQR